MMLAVETELSAVSKTAFFCCGMRAEDARSASSLCSDVYAEDFLTEEGRAIFATFGRSPRQNITMVLRSRLFQDEIALRIKSDRNTQVVNIGAGFDSRAFRVAGGRWFEFDEPAIIEHKNARLSAESCPNPLQRIAVDFENAGLRDALRACDPEANTVVVVEGVSMYLTRAQVIDLLQTLREAFPAHVLLCDLLGRTFIDRHMGKAYKSIAALGSEFKLREDHPEEIFLDAGYYDEREPISLVGRARDFGVVWVPSLLFRTALRSLRDGYRLHAFRTPETWPAGSPASRSAAT